MSSKMSCPQIHRVLVRLNDVCKYHSSFNNYYRPKININLQSNKKMNIEISKIINYLKHPYYSHLSR